MRTAGDTPKDVRRLADEIVRLSARDLLVLNQLLRDLPGWGGAGVREPRRPAPDAPGDSVAIAEDYAESAE